MGRMPLPYWLTRVNLAFGNRLLAPFTAYLIGARLLESYPLVPLSPHQALNIAVLSYDDQLCWGINTDRHLVPDRDAFASHLATAFAEILRASNADRNPRAQTVRPLRPDMEDRILASRSE